MNFEFDKDYDAFTQLVAQHVKAEDMKRIYDEAERIHKLHDASNRIISIHECRHRVIEDIALCDDFTIVSIEKAAHTMIRKLHSLHV